MTSHKKKSTEGTPKTFVRVTLKGCPERHTLTVDVVANLCSVAVATMEAVVAWTEAAAPLTSATPAEVTTSRRTAQMEVP